MKHSNDLLGSDRDGFAAAARALIGVSAFFLVPALAVVALMAPGGLGAAVSLGVAYFFPLVIWLIIFSRRAAVASRKSRSYAFGFALSSVSLGIFFAWLIIGLDGVSLEASTALERLASLLPTLGLLLFLGVPVSVVAALFYIGELEQSSN